MEVNCNIQKKSNLSLENNIESFKNIYRELGKKIREKKEENINLGYLLEIIIKLKKLYSKNSKNILLDGGINVLLPIFEILYKQLNNNNDETQFNNILKELTEILRLIFKNMNNIRLAENFNFFQILKLFIEEFDDNKIKILSTFIPIVIENIEKQENIELEQFSNFIHLFLLDEKLLKIFENNIKEKILSFIQNNKNKISEKLLLQILLMKKNFNENDVEKILLEKINININQKNGLSEKSITQNDFINQNNDNLIKEIDYQNNNECINENNFNIEKFKKIEDNISEKFVQNEEVNENIIQNEIINNYYQIFEYNQKIKKINKELIQKLSKFKVNIGESSFDNYEKIYFFYLMVNKYEKNNEVINFLKNQIEEYKQKKDNINYFEYRKIYKQIKKKLFSWNGYYSDFNVFYDKNEKNKKLKFKIFHFQTNEKVCPYLKPILDMNSYKPNIPKFNSEKIFRHNDLYSINLETFPFKKEKIPKNESYKCCIIKTTNHISGNIYLEDKYLLFIETAPSENEIQGYDFIDNTKMKCYGNTIYSKSGKGYFKKINYETINLILPRVYYYHKSGCEIFTTLNKSFYFKFKNEEISEKFYNEIRKIINQKEENLYDIFKKHKDDWSNNKISNLEYLMWLNIFSNRSYRDITQYPVFPWIIENYDLNNENLEKINYRNFKLPLGMMELGEKGIKRKNDYLNYYKICKESNLPQEKSNSIFTLFFNRDEGNDVNKIPFDEIPYLFGSHFSNPAYISHYLVRLFPYTLTAIDIQGEKFDLPERLFININKTFKSVTSEKSDLREIIPEFFTLPELFINLNDLNLGKLKNSNKDDSTSKYIKEFYKLKDDDNILVNEVLLPCKNNPYEFVFEYRKKLEKAKDIHYWIDLIFGKNAIYENAKKNNNLYMSYCYYDIMKNKIKNNEINDKEINSVYRLFELGFNPIPILKENNNERSTKIFSNIKLFFSCQPKNTEYLFKNNNENEGNETEEKNIKNYSSNVSISISKENEIYKICGTNKGILFIFDKRNNQIYKIINDHSKKIIDIFINKVLNLFSDISEDGFINIYTLPECELLNSIYLNNENEKFNKIYLTSSPLPAIIIQTSNKLISYNINGKFLNEIDNKNDVKDIIKEDFIDYLQLFDMTKFELPFFNKKIN